MKLLYSLLIIPVLCCNPNLATSKIDDLNSFSVVELFTSEGCSSCPPADMLLQQVAARYRNKNLLVLAYHVDYWERLGWKDRFSSAANSQRQRMYRNLFRLNSIYTPQAVVNGSM